MHKEQHIQYIYFSLAVICSKRITIALSPLRPLKSIAQNSLSHEANGTHLRDIDPKPFSTFTMTCCLRLIVHVDTSDMVACYKPHIRREGKKILFVEEVNFKMAQIF